VLHSKGAILTEKKKGSGGWVLLVAYLSSTLSKE
jgi:hypothetical protein